MAFSGGTFSRTFDCTTDRDNGVKILASKFDTELDGMATGLSTCILKDGTQTCTAAIPFAQGITLPDDKTIAFGTNSDVLIQYDETTTDSLKISAAEGAGLAITLMADEGDDAGDEWKLAIADGGTLTLGNDINSAGTYVTHLTITPNATVANSTMAVAGNLTVGGELDAATLDISGNADIDGTLEADAMTLNGTAITATATLNTGISNNNVPKFTSGAADNDFLRIDGTAIEGRSAAEVLSDIAAAPAAGSSNIVTTGALNSGSITSGFGSIDNGSSAITTTGAVSGGSFVAPDNGKIQLGASQDLEIYHDGSHSYINEQGTGNLKIVGSDISIEGSGETHATFVDDGAVTLYHNNAVKFATTATGVDVTGVITTDGMTTSADINFGDNDKAVFGAGTGDLEIYSDGTYSRIMETGGQFLVLDTNGSKVSLTSDNSKVMGDFIKDGAVQLHHNGSQKFSTTATGVDVTGTVGASGQATFGNDVVLSNDAYLYSSNGGSGVRAGLFFDGTNQVVKGFTAGSERMRLTSAGKLCVGTTAAVSNAMLNIVPADTNRIINTRSFNTDAQHHFLFENNSGTGVGTITCSTSATTFSTSSDYRLKTAVEYDWDATSRLKQLKPARFKWIVDGDDAVSVDGFLAHEVQSIVPESISGNGKDAMMDEEYEVSAATGDIYTPATDDADEVIHSANVENPDTLEEGQQWRETTAAVMDTRSVPDYQGIDQSKLVPLLVKTILELESRITALEAG